MTSVIIQHNNFLTLPKTLLWNLSSLQHLNAQFLVKLTTLPEGFLTGKSHLKTLYFVGSVNLGSQEKDRLPDDLFKGLTSLIKLDLVECPLHRLPNMSDLTVCGV